MLGARQATISSSAGDPFARGLSAASPAEGTAARRSVAPIGVMLRSAGRPLGMLEVADRPEREFTPRDEAILAQLGQLASVAIAKSQAYTRERHIAQVLQRSLLPPSLPVVPGLSAAVRFIAAGEGIEVGGDFYDFFRARGSTVAALIGDVCGKGPEAASVTALARHTLRAAAAVRGAAERRARAAAPRAARGARRRPLLHRGLLPTSRCAADGVADAAVLRRPSAAARRCAARARWSRSAGSGRCSAPTSSRC